MNYSNGCVSYLIPSSEWCSLSSLAQESLEPNIVPAYNRLYLAWPSPENTLAAMLQIRQVIPYGALLLFLLAYLFYGVADSLRKHSQIHESTFWKFPHDSKGNTDGKANYSKLISSQSSVGRYWFSWGSYSWLQSIRPINHTSLERISVRWAGVNHTKQCNEFMDARRWYKQKSTSYWRYSWRDKTFSVCPQPIWLRLICADDGIENSWEL